MWLEGLAALSSGRSVTAQRAKSMGSAKEIMTFLARDRPPPKWSNPSNGFALERTATPRKRYRPEEIASKLRQIDVFDVARQNVAEAVRSSAVTKVTYHRRRQEF